MKRVEAILKIAFLKGEKAISCMRNILIKDMWERNIMNKNQIRKNMLGKSKIRLVGTVIKALKPTVTERVRAPVILVIAAIKTGEKKMTEKGGMSRKNTVGEKIIITRNQVQNKVLPSDKQSNSKKKIPNSVPGIQGTM